MNNPKVVAVVSGRVYLDDGTVLLECTPGEPGQPSYRELSPIPRTDRAVFHATWDERKAS